MKLKIIPPIEPPRERPTAIHAKPCRHCPSAHFEPDPEAQQFKESSREIQLDSVFPCGWNNLKNCRGYCDYLGVSEADLIAHRGSP